MPWLRPSLRTLTERIARDFSGHLLDGSALLARSVLGVFSKVWAGACHLMHGFFAWAFLQVFPDTAEEAYLERWAWVWGLFLREAAKATGSIQLAGLSNLPGAVVPAGLVLQMQSTRQQYVTLEDAVIAADGAGMAIAVVRAEALVAGAAGNLPAGQTLALVTPFAGVQSTALVVGEGFTGGTDRESFEELRARLLARLRQPPRGGAKHDYEFWALQVPGVTRAWCYPLGLGIGTVSVCFLTENVPAAQGGPFPSAEMVARVQAHIDTVRPASVKEFLAFGPEPLPLTIRIQLTPDTLAVREAVTRELHDLLAREAAPGVILYRSHINEAISYAAGETDHKLLEPAADVEVYEGYFPVLEDIIFVEGA